QQELLAAHRRGKPVQNPQHLFDALRRGLLDHAVTQKAAVGLIRRLTAVRRWEWGHDAGFTGGLQIHRVVPEGHGRALEPVEAECKPSGSKIVAGADQVVLHGIRMEDARGPQVARVADRRSELLGFHRRGQLAGLLVEAPDVWRSEYTRQPTIGDTHADVVLDAHTRQVLLRAREVLAQLLIFVGVL